jgi:hypothetical protein
MHKGLAFGKLLPNSSLPSPPELKVLPFLAVPHSGVISHTHPDTLSLGCRPSSHRAMKSSLPSLFLSPAQSAIMASSGYQ